MNKQKESSCVIKRACGSAEHSVHEEIIAACGKKTPLLAWAEPQADWYGHGTGRHPQFVPLQRLQGATPDWPEDLPLAEARLFWPDRALHIVADEDGGCCWARIEEVSKEEKYEQSDYIFCVNIEMLPVYTLRDLARFGIVHHEHAPFPEKLNAITYHQQGRLVGWRLTGDQTNA